MQTAINTDNFVMTVMETLMASMDMWAEQERLNQVKAALYMNLMDKTILEDDHNGRRSTLTTLHVWLKCGFGVCSLKNEPLGQLRTIAGSSETFSSGAESIMQI